jgi:DNA-damage-inducible protein D
MEEKIESKENALVVFRGMNIRRLWHKDEWYYSVVDVIAILTDSPSPRQYWGVLKAREDQLLTICLQLKLPSKDGKSYATDCANTESMLRIIQSIPSKNAEPFKRWLAEVGYERIQEIENPELAQDRSRKYYEMKGYPQDWIEKRIRGIAIRQDLTQEWQQRGIKENKEFAILTNEISKATFGINIKDHKKIKNLDPIYKNQNLRDHMNDLELIFSMLGEKLTTEATINKNSQGFTENKEVAQKSGKVAGRAREDAEKTLGVKVVSEKNYLDLTKKRKELKMDEKAEKFWKPGEESDSKKHPPQKKKVEFKGENVRNALAQLVLTVVELLRELLEKQALRRIESGELPDEQVENLGLTFMQLKKEVEKLKNYFQLEDEDLNLDLGPLSLRDIPELPDDQKEKVSAIELLDRLLSKGVIARGNIVISVAEVDLISANLGILLASIDKAKEYYAAPSTAELAEEARLLREENRLLKSQKNK